MDNLAHTRHEAASIVVSTLENHWPEALDKIKVEWNPRLTSTAGRAWRRTHNIELATKILPYVGTKGLKRTVVHELAHLFVWHKWGHKASAHGREWKGTTLAWGADPSRTHKYFEIPAVCVALGRTVASCSVCGRKVGVSKRTASRIKYRRCNNLCGATLRVMSPSEDSEWKRNQDG